MSSVIKWKNKVHREKDLAGGTSRAKALKKERSWCVWGVKRYFLSRAQTVGHGRKWAQIAQDLLGQAEGKET